MNFKKMITAIELLALTGVMSVGFSTWVIVETNFSEIDIKVETENVFNTNEYLTISNVTFSDYDQYGFFKDFIYSDDHNLNTDTSGRTLTGYLEFDIDVDLSKCGIFNGKLNFEISIDTIIIGYDEEFYIINVANSIKRDATKYYIDGLDGGIIENKQFHPINNSINDNFSIETDKVTGYLSFELKYGFEFSNMGVFEKAIAGPFEDGKDFPFNIKVLLKGGD